MKGKFVFFYSIIVSSVQLAECQLKKYNLSMLLVFPMAHPGCVPAVNIILNNVNNRMDVLPDYNIISDMRHEEDFFRGWAPVRELVLYSRSWENRPDDGLIRSPVFVGPFFPIACKAYGRVLKYFNMVSIAMACNAPYLADKIAYPNMYNVQGNWEQYMLSMVHFFKQIGGWSKIGILAHVEAQDYTGAVNLQKFASQSGIFVPSLNVVIDITDDVIDELLFHNIRVIAFINTQAPLVWKFLCKTWLSGIKGPRYVFFLMNAMALEPRNLAASQFQDPWCNAGIVREQFRYTIFIGPALQAIDDSRVTELGYNVTQFEDTLVAIMQRPRNATVGSFKHVCHDATLMSVFALQDADNRLKKEFNMSLRDMNSSPEFVMKIFNESVLNANVSGLRTQTRFSKRGFSENDRVIYSYYDQAGFRNKYYTFDVENARPEMVFGKYKTYAFEPFDWAAWMNDGKPPNDQAFDINSIKDVSFEISLLISILAGLAIVVQIFMMIVTMKYRNRYTSPLVKIFGYIGCIVLNGVAISFAVHTTSVVLATTRYCLLVISVSVVTGIGSIRAYLIAVKLRKRCKSRRKIKSFQRPIGNNTLSSPLPRSRRVELESGIDKKTLTLVALFILINAVYVAAWLAVDSFGCRIINAIRDSYYDLDSDTNFNFTVLSCASWNNQTFAFCLLFLHIVLLIFGTYQAYHVNRARKALVNECCNEVLGIIGVPLNAMSLLLCACLVITALDDIIQQRLAVIFGSFLLSSITSLCFGYKLLPQ